VQRHIKQLAGEKRRPVIVAHSLREYVRACGRCNNKPAGSHSYHRPTYTQHLHRMLHCTALC
jgi:hypothetical protein